MGYRALLTLATWLCLCAGALAQTDGASQPGDLWLFVFDNGNPVPGVQMRLDGKPVATSSPAGAIYAQIPPGRHDLTLLREGAVVLELDLLTAEDEDIQILVSLDPGRDPQVGIISSGTAPVRPGESEAQTRALAAINPGLLEGFITSAESGAPVVGAKIYVAGTDKSATTDLAGRYHIELRPGVYTLSIVHPGFAPQTLENIRVIPGKVVTASMDLAPAGVQLAEYTVTAPYIEGSVASILSVQEQAAGVVNVIGAEQISRTGDSDAAEALQRVAGLTIEQGKFVVIRGQPSRYTYTEFNGSPLPSPDPVRQAVPLDLFPADILASIAVQKTYTVDKPGRFGGGLIALNTRGVPKDEFVSLEVETGYNSLSTGELGATYEGSQEDFLGQDGGQRELPDAIPPAGTNLSVQQARSFNDLFLVETLELPPDIEFEASGGIPLETDYGTFGVLASAAYKHNYRLIQERDIDYEGNEDAQRIEQNFLETRTDRDIQISAFLVLGAEWEHHSLTLNNFFIRDTTDRTQISDGITRVSDEEQQRRFLLEFNQRELLLHQLLGAHDFGWLKLDWRAQTANGERERPDRRDYSYTAGLFSDDRLIFNAEDGLRRAFNQVEDKVDSFGLDFTFDAVTLGATDTVFSLGYSQSEQTRDSETRSFVFEPGGRADLSGGLIEFVINDATIGNTVEFRELITNGDDYTGSADISGYYAQADVRVGDWLRAVGGLRRETADFEIVTFQRGTDAARTTSGFNLEEILPALALTFFVGETMQVRVSGSKTLSYPLLIELSNTLFFDPDTGEAFSGNPDLGPTEITSYDLRFEWYPSSTQSFTAGLFVKEFTNPIERRFLPRAGGGDSIQFANAPSADVRGVEVGGRLDLESLALRGWLPDWDLIANSYIQGNFAYIDSEVQIDAGGIATNDQRPLQGQADTVVNLQIGYDGVIHDVTLALNRVGERLAVPGLRGLPDVIRQPATFLDATYALTIPSDLPVPFLADIPFIGRFFGEGQLKLKAENLLSEERVFLQGGLIERRVITGRSFSASLSWNFF